MNGKAKAQMHDEMVKMAGIYENSENIEEFLVNIDLMSFEYVPSTRWRNPFFIYDLMRRQKKSFLSKVLNSLYSTMMLMNLFIIFSHAAFMAIFVVALQIVAVSTYLYISKKECDAMCALSDFAITKFTMKK